MRPIYNEPVVYKNFITNGECEYIKRKAMSRLKRSTVSEDYTIDDKIYNKKMCRVNKSSNRKLRRFTGFKVHFWWIL